ncbi:MAG: ABC transporter ATP-binding protein/permease [Lachnospiraceae bacterium]|nr:ABC transporter ATP-binding protein/permease [Lachnospiraceae bacterium]
MEHKWKRLLSYYKSYLGLFFSDMFFAILGAGVTLAIPLIVRYITYNVIQLPSGEALPIITRLGIVMAVMVAVECFCNFYTAYYGHIMGTKIEHDMRAEIFSHYQKLSFTFYDNQQTGQLLSRITSDLFDISELLHHGPEDIVISVIKLVGSFVILSQINLTLCLVTYLFIPIIACYALYLNKKMKVAFKENRKRIGDINGQIEDSLSGIRVVKSFGNEHMEEEKFHVGNERFVQSKRRSYWYMALYNSGLGVMTTLVTIVVLLTGTGLITAGVMAIADLITFLLYINNFTEPIKKLITLTEQFQNGFSGYERFLEIMDIQPDIKDAPDAISIDQAKGEICFKNVSFKYEEGQDTVLSHIDLNVKAGDYLAIVGASGGGKTTLCSLIPRFYDVDSGEIQLDGTDIRKIKLADLRRQIGIVQQDVYLFTENIMENIRYGKPEATDEEVIGAAKLANAHEFITQLPDGYYTDIGQRGVKLSGGQKQRLSIARVFLKNPPILIFDEATSALDNESERIVQQSLEKLAKGRTTFVIAHRLSTIRNAQKILVLTPKGIEEQGTHEELLAKNGVYTKLYENR